MRRSLHRRRGLMVLGAALTLSAAAWAQGKPSLNLDADGVAIQGHDPVAYFTQSKSVKGSPSLAARHDGAVYWFASAEHLNAFNAEPARYVPQYGGYCAYGVSQGAKPGIDPVAFSIVDGRLYLNLNRSVQSRWLKDTRGYIQAADEKWPALSAR